MFDEPIIEASTREVVTIMPDTSIAKTIAIMEKNKFHNLVVLDSAEIYMVNILDLLIASNPESYVDEFMFKPHCIHKDTPCIDAICELTDSGQRAAPIVDDNGELVGITTDYDIMKEGSKSQILKKMVGCLERHSGWDFVYANLNIIGADGEFLHDSPWYEGYQDPAAAPL